MTDIERSLAEIVALLPDNTVGETGPQDGREAVLSLAPAAGALDIVVSAPTTIAIAGTFVAVVGTTLLRADARQVASSGDGQLSYQAPPRRRFLVALTAVLSSSAVGARELGLVPWVDGSAPTNVQPIRVTVAGSGARATLSGLWLLSIDSGAIVRAAVTDYTASGTVTVESLHLAINGGII